MSTNTSSLCSHSNPSYVEDVRVSRNDHYSGCAIPSDATGARIVEACCEALGDDFDLTYQEWFQLFAETEDDDVPCYTTCLANVSDTHYADSQNITDCVRLTAEEQAVELNPKSLQCGGPTMRTPGSLGTRQAGGVHEALGWGVGVAALVACLVNL